MNQTPRAMKKLKIVIVVSYTYPYIDGGLGVVAAKQAEYLARLGHQVTLISANWPKTKSEFVYNQVNYIKLPAIRFFERFEIPVPLFLMDRRAIASIKAADVVHAHDMAYPSSLQAALLAKLFRKPLILTQHIGRVYYPSKIINLLESMVRMTLGRVILKLSDKVILINKHVIKALTVDRKKVVTILNGVDTEMFKPVNEGKKIVLRKKYNLPVDKQIVLFVGRLVKKKGYEELCKAKDQKYLIVIVGKGKAVNEKEPDNDQVRFLGVVPHDVLREIYQLADVFVLPSMSEGLPLTIQEAMASGLPIITSKHPGFEDYLDSRWVKFISPNHQQIKKAILEVLENHSLKEQMSQYALQVSINKNSWGKNVEKLLLVYQQAIFRN